MAQKWTRWRGYMDELEDAMRMCGEHLAEAERLVAAVYERDTWKGKIAASADREIVRRALDIPFLRGLVRNAAAIDDLDALAQPDFAGRAWRDGESSSRQISAERASDIALSQCAASRSDAPPQRLRAAERALANRTRSIVVVLDDMVTARNASAVVRTTDALGLQEIHFIQGDGKLRLARTVATLSQRWLDLHWHREPVAAIEDLKRRGYRVLTADFGSGARTIEEVALSEKIALVFGSEQRGVRAEVRALADGSFFVPTLGFTSYLNVSVAAGISLYALDRRMRSAGLREPLADAEKRALRPVWYDALARGSRGRAWQYRSWLDQPPDPAPEDMRRPLRNQPDQPDRASQSEQGERISYAD